MTVPAVPDPGVTAVTRSTSPVEYVRLFTAPVVVRDMAHTVEEEEKQMPIPNVMPVMFASDSVVWDVDVTAAVSVVGPVPLARVWKIWFDPATAASCVAFTVTVRPLIVIGQVETMLVWANNVARENKKSIASLFFILVSSASSVL